MNTIFWLVFLFILARSIWRLMERAGDKDKFEGPLGSPPPNMGRPIPGSEEQPKLKIPEYLTRRSEQQPSYEQPGELSAQRKDWEAVGEYRDPAILAGDMTEPCLKGKPAGLCPEGSLKGAAVEAECGMTGKKESPARERRGQEDLFSDMLCPGQVVKGMAWAQILGPRGGLHSKR
ncbi:MAG: hypothetical protein PHT62_06110 [Desulfotomaculaceae bacterium]|nr:hypothetical protein [Desulfotomaculaceae bacterium]